MSELDSRFEPACLNLAELYASQEKFASDLEFLNKLLAVGGSQSPLRVTHYTHSPTDTISWLIERGNPLVKHYIQMKILLFCGLVLVIHDGF